MNRDYLLDSLDGLKGLVFRLLPADVVALIGCVPMTTDGPWSDEEKTVFETVIGIPKERVYWTPGGFKNVPSAADRDERSRWVHAVAAIKQRYLFLDPDTGFYTHHTGVSEKMVLVSELKDMLRGPEALIIPKRCKRNRQILNYAAILKVSKNLNKPCLTTSLPLIVRVRLPWGAVSLPAL